jgi:serine/threonine protein kinase
VGLTPGAQLGSYTVTSQIGKGGMGEVWKARDTRLGRDVALKVLPDAFARDGDRLARFDREARLLASLNHPNIAASTDSNSPTARRFSCWSSSRERRSPTAWCEGPFRSSSP